MHLVQICICFILQKHNIRLICNKPSPCEHCMLLANGAKTLMFTDLYKYSAACFMHTVMSNNMAFS